MKSSEGKTYYELLTSTVSRLCVLIMLILTLYKSGVRITVPFVCHAKLWVKQKISTFYQISNYCTFRKSNTADIFSFQQTRATVKRLILISTVNY